MRSKDIVIAAISAINRAKDTRIEILDIEQSDNNNVRVDLLFRKTGRKYRVNIASTWFNWHYKMLSSIINLKNANIPEELSDEQKVILRLGYLFYEISESRSNYYLYPID